MAKVVNKTVDLELVGLNGNAYNLLGQFQRQAKIEKWTKEEIKTVVNEAKKGDYDHLLYTLMEHCESKDESDDEDSDDDNGYVGHGCPNWDNDDSN